MQQAALLNGLGFDLLSSFEDGFSLAEVDIGGGEIAQALVIAVVDLSRFRAAPSARLSYARPGHCSQSTLPPKSRVNLAPKCRLTGHAHASAFFCALISFF